MNQRHLKKNAKKGKKWLVAPTILKLEKSLSNKIFCSNYKLKMLFLKLFFIFQFESTISYSFVSWQLGIFLVQKIPLYLILSNKPWPG